MRLAAIYIYENSLPHIFGENHKELTLNFGGEYIYEYTQNEKGNLIEINKEKNKDYIRDFFGVNIENISSLVGANGTGKTTIIDLIKSNRDNWIIEDEGNNQLIIYYTPYIRVEDNNFENIGDISKYIMMERDADYERMAFSEVFQYHNSEKTKRFLHFMNRNDIISVLSDTSLPYFNRITISTNYLKEDHHQTSNGFRQFFDRFYELESIERNKRINDEIKSSNVQIDEYNRSKKIGKINFETRLIINVIHKVHSILESSGNKYLSEGYMNDGLTSKSKEFATIDSMKDAFYYFLDNAYIQLTAGSEKIFFPKKEIKELIELLISSIREDQDFSKNWGEYEVSFAKAIEIIEAYDRFLIAFRKDFNYDKKALFNFEPNISLSTGEEALFELFSSLNDLNYRIDNKIENNRYNINSNIYDSYLILLDEADLGFHPLWKKRYINTLLKVIPKIFSDKKIQIIFTTHDPLTLSDIPNDKIIYLNKVEGKTIIETGKKSFGANIIDLLSDSFFIEGNLIGDFAKAKIEEAIKWINKSKESPIDINEDKYNYYKQVISVIDEPIIRVKLSEMLEELIGDNSDFQKEMIQKEIDYLINKKENL